ncbi:bile acid:sodium symporter [Halomonas urumqiensis]|uniref:Bile acid:sodium symporter n=1 Tax=Halomonas urumqiensis TaxID=1684789 RepID=A0A2N7UFJ1_9GAMM|nr:bile acid:sodium symporter [Halomonas urumqiensis]PMR79180.1 bile acid:sodium symporter [Halomonas urumqiensis]PTB03855.1 bile acid:sodium symporter [Halomonas urumqiensis]GHE19909.1 arsenic resistance protein [Halomonas urumqiensis]
MRVRLEKYQVGVYLAMIMAGLMLGRMLPGMAAWLDGALWPLLATLLYVTFTQVPLVGRWRQAGRRRFLAAALLGNFLIIPLLVWGAVSLLPPDPALRLGVLLVLLVPCTDWFITFTHLGGGDTGTAIGFTPLSLLLQLALLPLYLWLFLDQAALIGLFQRELLVAFGGLILLPLMAAYATERWARASPARQQRVERLGDWPMPLLGLVLFVVAAGQVSAIADAPSWLAWLIPFFILYLGLAALLARSLARLFGLPAAQGRVLAFSFGSRNSFVVLPIALALPAGLEAAVMVVVCQSLVELFGMLAFLRLVPGRWFPDGGAVDTR